VVVHREQFPRNSFLKQKKKKKKRKEKKWIYVKTKC